MQTKLLYQGQFKLSSEFTEIVDSLQVKDYHTTSKILAWHHVVDSIWHYCWLANTSIATKLDNAFLLAIWKLWGSDFIDSLCYDGLSVFHIKFCLNLFHLNMIGLIQVFSIVGFLNRSAITFILFFYLKFKLEKFNLFAWEHDLRMLSWNLESFADFGAIKYPLVKIKREIDSHLIEHRTLFVNAYNMLSSCLFEELSNKFWLTCCNKNEFKLFHPFEVL